MVNMYGGYNTDILQNFDQAKNYEIYFPENNLEKILDEDMIYER